MGSHGSGVTAALAVSALWEALNSTMQCLEQGQHKTAVGKFVHQIIAIVQGVCTSKVAKVLPK